MMLHMLQAYAALHISHFDAFICDPVSCITSCNPNATCTVMSDKLKLTTYSDVP